MQGEAREARLFLCLIGAAIDGMNGFYASIEKFNHKNLYTLCEVEPVPASAFPAGHPLPKKPHVTDNATTCALRFMPEKKLRQYWRFFSVRAASASTWAMTSKGSRSSISAILAQS